MGKCRWSIHIQLESFLWSRRRHTSYRAAFERGDPYLSKTCVYIGSRHRLSWMVKLYTWTFSWHPFGVPCHPPQSSVVHEKNEYDPDVGTLRAGHHSKKEVHAFLNISVHCMALSPSINVCSPHVYLLNTHIWHPPWSFTKLRGWLQRWIWRRCPFLSCLTGTIICKKSITHHICIPCGDVAVNDWWNTELTWIGHPILSSSQVILDSPHAVLKLNTFPTSTCDIQRLVSKNTSMRTCPTLISSSPTLQHGLAPSYSTPEFGYKTTMSTKNHVLPLQGTHHGVSFDRFVHI